MSALTEELPKKVIQDWRNFAASPSFQAGIDWLRHNKSADAGETDILIVRSAAKWKGYMEALDDVQDTLTKLPEKALPLDNAPELDRP